MGEYSSRAPIAIEQKSTLVCRIFQGRPEDLQDSDIVSSRFRERKDYIATNNAMDVVGIHSEEQDATFRVVAAILHLGNIEFTKGKEMDSSTPKDEKSWFHLKTAAELFMCDVKSLEDSLCKRVIVTRDQTITKWLDPESVVVSGDALAKVVYSRLFDWSMVGKFGWHPLETCSQIL